LLVLLLLAGGYRTISEPPPEKGDRVALVQFCLLVIFLAAMSHDLRTPLNAIMGFSDMMQTKTFGPLGDAHYEQYALDIYDSGALLVSLINDILDISKIEAGKISLRRDSTDMVVLARSAIDELENSAAEEGLELKESFSSEVIKIYADGDKVLQVLTNLIANALRFTEEGFIEVSIQEKPNSVECCVTDTGRGIKEEDLPLVFEKFQQFGRTHGPGDRGTGLGLAICKGIVELHHGKIRVESEVGKGSKFIFEVPKVTAREVLKEYIASELKESPDANVPLTAAAFDIERFEELKTLIGIRQTEELIVHLNEVTRHMLRRKADISLAAEDSIFVMFPETERSEAVSVLERIHNVLKRELSKSVEQQPTTNISYRFACYPEEAGSEDELIDLLERRKA